jgi:hypothetical protein
MSKGELWKGVAISAVIALVFGVIGGHIIYNALEMVGAFGEDLGANARSRLIYAESHRWVHLFAAACGLAIGWFLRGRNWWLFTFSLLAILACGAYGVQNMYGFGVKNRVGVAIAKVDDKAAANLQYENARKDLQEQIRWLQRMSTQEDGRERRRLLAEVDAKRKELSALKPPTVTADNAMADTSATGLATLTSTSAEFHTFLWPLILAVLMFMGESLSFVIVGHMLSGIVALFATYLAVRVQPVQQPDPPPVRSRNMDNDEDGDGQGSPNKGCPAFPGGRPDGAMLNRAAGDEVSASSTVDTEVAVSSGAPGVEVSAPSAGQRLKPTKRALNYLMDNPDKAQESVRTLSRLIGVSKSTVAKAIKEFKGQRRRLGRVQDRSSDIRGMRNLKEGGLPLYA